MRFLVACLLLSSCFDDLPADGSLGCAAGARACPKGYHCADDQRCWHDGHEPDLSASSGYDGGDLAGFDAARPGDAGDSGIIPEGQSCTDDSACTSGFCTDGVCCDQRCHGQCQACNLPGLVGSCRSVPAGPPATGHTPCSGSGTPCGGRCDGVGGLACLPAGGSVTCGATCNGVCNGAGGCSTAGQCPAGLACNGTTCRTSCSSNADCQSGYACDGSGCVLHSEVDCLNGIDDNGDGLADCQDPSCAALVTCVPDSGDEIGVNLPSATTCADPFPVPLHQGLNFAAFCQGCSCSPTMTCPVTLTFANTAGCPDIGSNPVESLQLKSGLGDVAGTCKTITIPGPSPTPTSVKLGTPAAGTPGCSLTGSTATPVPTWTVSTKWCRSKSSNTCGAGQRCVTRPPTGQTLCVRLPNGSICPAGFDTGNKQTWYGNYTDNRMCTSCGCTVNGGTPACGSGSSDSLTAYNGTTCSSSIGTVPGGNVCSGVAALGSYLFTKSATGVAFPTCSAPTGSGTAATADPSLICCPTCSCVTAPCTGPSSGCPSGNMCDGSACVPCHTLTNCGASCTSCLGDSCATGTCKCGNGPGCDSTRADNCTGGQCRCGGLPACVGGFFGCISAGMCF